jgi:hypothetical protein
MSGFPTREPPEDGMMILFSDGLYDSNGRRQADRAMTMTQIQLNRCSRKFRAGSRNVAQRDTFSLRATTIGEAT